ncbi:MAG: tRNA (adenosine(37)-N6)-threonylcarbamoyltransferase complex dimerization subunit type 1 TsaB [Oscillospiraceae bacterium]|jgi:tRNA threonylcarbamoyladenosine biosynthesis protein TsaB|nr:tRNA (adenosine(37)-N6)-threonylcarbamoyltransferase complex dimerization subunit type 1 TsaB [Oscillospiraceae bacterium]
MKVLAIETSGSVTSVAFGEDYKIFAELFLNTELKSSCTLMPAIRSILDCLKQSLSEVDAFATSIGPGSFTGIRVGISAIKGMAFALKKPCIGVSSLEIIATQVIVLNTKIVVVISAGFDRIYTASFKNCRRKLLRETEDRLLSLEEFKNYLKDINENIILVGNASKKCLESISEKTLKEKISLFHENFNFPRASGVLKLAQKTSKTNSNDLYAKYLCTPHYVYKKK